MADAGDEKTEELNARIDEMIAGGDAVTQEWCDLWQDGIDYIFGNQLSRTKRRKGWERIQDNHIFPALTQQIATLIQRQPTVEPSPYETADAPFIPFWRGLLQWQFDNDLRMAGLAAASVLDAGIYGYYVGHVFWERKAEWMDKEKRWRGRPRTILVRPEYFGADPDCETLDDAAYVYCRRRMLLEKAVALWPDWKAKIEEAALDEQDAPPAGPVAYSFDTDYDDEEEEIEESSRRSVEGRLAQFLLRRARGEEWRPSSKAGAKGDLPQFVTVTQIYFRDGQEMEGEELGPVAPEKLIAAGHITRHPEAKTYHVANPAAFPAGLAVGDEVPKEVWPTEAVRKWSEEPVFPHGRFVLRIGKTILNPDPADQRYAFRKWPFIVGVNQSLPHTWQGLNAVEMPRGLQDWVNVSVAHLANYVKFFGDPVVMAEPGAIDKDPDNRKIAGKIRATAGAIWRLGISGLAKIRREPPVPMPAGTMAIWDAMKAELKDQVGMQDVGLGRQTRGNPTAFEVSQLARNSQVRTSMAAVYQDLWMADVMGLVAEMDQAHLEVGDSVRIAGEAQRGAAVAIAAGACDARFDVVMKIGQALPFDQERMRTEAKDLFAQIGPAYLPELLDAYGVKNKEAVLQRVQQWQSFVAWQQAAEAAGAAPAVGAGGPASPQGATPGQALVLRSEEAPLLRRVAGEAPLEEIIAAAAGEPSEGEAPVEELAAAAQPNA